MKKEIELTKLSLDKIRQIFNGDYECIRASGDKPDLKSAFDVASELFLKLFNINRCDIELFYSKSNQLSGFRLSNSNGEFGVFKPNDLKVFISSFSIYSNNSPTTDFCNLNMEVYFDSVEASKENINELIFIGDTQYNGHFGVSESEDGVNGLGFRGVADNNMQLLGELQKLRRFFLKLEATQKILNSKKA